MESLKKWREPAAWLTIGVLALTMLLGVIELVVVGASLRPTLALGIGAKIGNPTIFVVLAGIVASCVLVEPTARARLITLLAVLTSVLALLAALLLTLLSLGSQALRVDIAGVAVTLVISGLAVAVLIKLFQLQPAPAVSGPAPQQQPVPELPAAQLQPDPPDPQLTADLAAGCGRRRGLADREGRGRRRARCRLGDAGGAGRLAADPGRSDAPAGSAARRRGRGRSDHGSDAGRRRRPRPGRRTAGQADRPRTGGPTRPEGLLRLWYWSPQYQVSP